MIQFDTPNWKPENLDRAVNEEKAALASFIEAQHAEVLRDHDPRVRRLRKRNKVMIAKGAFDGL